MKIKEIQEWEKEFAKRKGLPPKDKNNAGDALIVGFFKLSEEIGELAEALLRRQYGEVQAEASDIIIFTCKIAKIVEDYFGQPSLSKILKEKIKYAERRQYDERESDLTKPDGGFEKRKAGHHADQP